jgi:fatty acid desaturase
MSTTLALPSLPARPPKLPAQFYKKSPLWTMALITTMVVFFAGSAALNCYLWLDTSLPILAKIVLSLPLFALGGQGIHLMGFIGHDGMHFTLSKNRHVSLLLASAFSSGTLIFIQMGMTLDHWTHHKYCNTPLDPDLRLFGRHSSFLSRVLLARSSASRLYFRRAFRMLLGMPLDPSISRIVFPLKGMAMRVHCLFNFACAAAWAALYVGLALIDWRIVLLGFAIPLLFTNAISGLRPYAEHMGLDGGTWTNSRSRTSLFWTILDFGGNYHLEHHLYPSVPQWQLPGVHGFLRDGGYLDHPEIGLEPTILGAYAKTFGPYRFPEGMDQPASEAEADSATLPTAAE